jgi:hypothetical protein
LNSFLRLVAAGCLGAAVTTAAFAQSAPPASPESASADNAAQLAKQGFYKAFPPPGVEVVSWNVVMGIGQVLTLRLPASRLREVNRIFEDTAWGAYRTEFYPTYDYKAVGLGEHEKAK